MLPSKNEMPSLLDDLTFVATDAGLKINSLDWNEPVPKDFYIEFPIKISVTGGYHEMGHMISSVANLPRIVSLHDFVMTKEPSGDLMMNIFAKTYRFREDGEKNVQGKGKP